MAPLQIESTSGSTSVAESTSDTGILVRTKSAKGTGLIVVAQDLENPDQEDARGNHERSQEHLHIVLKHRGIKSSTFASFVSNDEAHLERHRCASGNEDSLERRRCAYTNTLFGRLRQRGIHGVRTFRGMLHNTDFNADGTCPGRTVEGWLTHLGIRLRDEEYQLFLELFGVGSEHEEMVDYVMLLAHGCRNWSTQRLEVVKEAYDYLSSFCPGGIMHTDIIATKFQSEALTSDHVPKLLEHQSAHEFLAQWNNGVLGADGVVTWVDFVDYYLDVSMCFDSEQDFCLFVCKSWGMDMDDWLAKKIFLQFTTSDTAHTLPSKDFLRMLDELDPSITKEEALAWYEAIDEDDSGEVTLQEFLSSKVLKVKRLFESFDVDNSHTVNKKEMLQILKNLNPSISEEEALALYTYCDLDGNGEISFCEFLKNDLLKMLQIFESFDKNRSGSLSESEMKTILRKLDPYLEDYDIQQIYKAIDTDKSGSLSFVEFCESHVVRAKALFDRYDTSRARTLTQFKFRELMLDIDASLTSAQLEAVYNMVADPNSGKVQLGGFLNPNIVRLKLLFDKYDQDRSKYLDSQEFKLMLKDVFKNGTDKDIEAVQRAICPPGADQGITFTMYIQRFKEISRKYELIQLAKRREARNKAQSKGLVYVP